MIKDGRIVNDDGSFFFDDDDYILFVVLFANMAVNIFQRFFPDKFEVLYAWSTTVIFINPSLNPVIYLVRKSEIRTSAVLSGSVKCG